jgi:hypothetical protein
MTQSIWNGIAIHGFSATAPALLYLLHPCSRGSRQSLPGRRVFKYLCITMSATRGSEIKSSLALATHLVKTDRLNIHSKIIDYPPESQHPSPTQSASQYLAAIAQTPAEHQHPYVL